MIRGDDFVSPLVCGDLAVEGIDLTVDRTDDMDTAKADQGIIAAPLDSTAVFAEFEKIMET